MIPGRPVAGGAREAAEAKVGAEEEEEEVGLGACPHVPQGGGCRGEKVEVAMAMEQLGGEWEGSEASEGAAEQWPVKEIERRG